MSRDTYVYTHKSRVPRMDESYKSSRHKKGVPHVNKSRHPQESTHIRVETHMCTLMKVVSHVWTSHTSRVDVRVESHVWTSHVTHKSRHTRDSRHIYRCTQIRVVSHVRTSHTPRNTHMHTHTGVESHLWTSHTYAREEEIMDYHLRLPEIFGPNHYHHV